MQEKLKNRGKVRQEEGSEKIVRDRAHLCGEQLECGPTWEHKESDHMPRSYQAQGMKELKDLYISFHRALVENR